MPSVKHVQKPIIILFAFHISSASCIATYSADPDHSDPVLHSLSKRLTSWRLFVMSNCDFVTFPCGILGQLWYMIVLIPALCRLSYFQTFQQKTKQTTSVVI